MKNIDSIKPEEFDHLWNYSQPEITVEQFRSLIDIIKAHEDKTLYPQLLTQIARCETLLRNFESASLALQEAIVIIEQLQDIDKPLPSTRYFLEKGRWENWHQESDRGKSSFLLALNIAMLHSLDFYAVDAMHMLGIVCQSEESLEWNKKAMLYAEKSTDLKAKSWLGALYNNIGWTYHSKEDFNAALECFLKSEMWFKERKRLEESLIAKWSAAKMMRLLGRIGEALLVHYECAEQRKLANLEHDGYIAEEIGECLLSLNKIDDATPFFASAYTILCEDNWFAQHEFARLERLKQLGKC